MNECNKISIIVPIYNIEKYIEKCIESIICQTYANLEIILVDDGSQDRSGLICDIYAQKDNRIRVIHKSNGGLSDARNRGLDEAHGSFIQFVDGDDYIDPEMCEKLLNAVLEQKADIGVCSYKIVFEEGTSVPEKQKTHQLVKNEVIAGHAVIEEKANKIVWLVMWNKLYRKELFQNLRFPKGKQHEDEFVFFNLFSHCNLVACLAESLYFYVQREGSIMAAPFSVHRLDACEAIFQRVDQLISGGYSAASIYRAIARGIRVMWPVFVLGLYRESAYHQTYKALLYQYRRIGLTRMICSVHGAKEKVCVAANYISPLFYWSLYRMREQLHQKLK